MLYMPWRGGFVKSLSYLVRSNIHIVRPGIQVKGCALGQRVIFLNQALQAPFQHMGIDLGR